MQKCFCVIALQIFREILKKYRKSAITLQIAIFQKIEKTIFRQSQEDYHAKVANVLAKRCGYNRKNISKHIHNTHIHAHKHPAELR